MWWPRCGPVRATPCARPYMVFSVTPSGVGVTEGGMIVTFTSLGVPLETAVAGALLFRLVAFWLPMVAGFISLHAYPVRAGAGPV